MRWIREHKLIASLLSLLVVLALIFVLSTVSGFGGNFLTDFINNGVSGISGFFSSVGGNIRDGAAGIFAHKDLEKQIDELKDENAQLQRDLIRAKLEAEQLQQLQELAGILHYDYTPQTFNVVSADVSLKDGSNWLETFTIDRGTEDGITQGKVVIDGAGLVGVVSDAGEGWAKVTPIIEEGSKISFKLARDGKQLGVVAGDSKGQFTGYMLDDGSTVSEGDILVTSGMGMYPAGIEIGTVKSVTYNSDKLLKEITVEPAVKFSSLRKVAVII